MNNIEKLYDIEQDFDQMLKTGTYTVMPSDIRWLINKVKDFTNAADKITSCCIVCSTCAACDLKKVLEE